MPRSFVLLNVSLQLQNQFFRWLSYGIAISIPFPVGINSTLSVLLMVVWLLIMEKDLSWEKIKSVLLWSTLFLLAVVGLSLTKNLDEAYFRIQQKLLFLLFPMIYGTVGFNWREQAKGILASFLAGVFLASIFCLLIAFFRFAETGSTIYFFSKELVENKVVDLYPYVMAVLCLTAIMVLAENIVWQKVLPNFFSPFVCVLASLFFAAMVLLLGVKQLFIALILVLTFYAVRVNRKQIYLLLIVVCGSLTLSIFAVPVLKGRLIEALAEQGKENPLSQNPEAGTPLNGVALRRAIWVCAVDVIQRHPLLGVGTGDAQDELQKSYLAHQFILAGKYNRFNTHNQYLQVAVTFGVVGLAIWLASIGWLIHLNRKNWMLLSLLGVLFFSMLTESMLETNKGILTFMFLTTMATWPFTEKKK